MRDNRRVGTRPSTEPVALSVRPANEVAWEDVEAVFGSRGSGVSCWCTRFKIPSRVWFLEMPPEVKKDLLRDGTGCGSVDAASTAGLVGYLGDEPVGWCAVEPRSAYPHLPKQRVQCAARGETPDDDSVWAVTCFFTRVGHRRTGVTGELLRAAVEHARAHGARALEGYPMLTHPGKEITWDELHVGSRSTFEDAGFEEVAHPTKRRYVMRLDF
jgi:GNAT superfamily N-acetyltransferase